MIPPGAGDRWKFNAVGLILPEGFSNELDPRLDEVILRLPCFEPSGFTMELRVTDILRHLLLVGQTGSGKTTVLNRIWSDLINYRSAHTGQRAGLLILDSQGDNTVSHIRELAEQAGRADDLRVLSPQEGFFNPMSELTTFASVETVASKIISASSFNNPGQDHRDAYWIENIRTAIEAGLTYLLIDRTHIGVIDAFQFLADLFLSTDWTDRTKAILDRCERIISASAFLSEGIRAKIGLARITIDGWRKMDARTKSILQSCLGLTISPFLAASALRYWDVTKGALVSPSDALEGKIVVVSTRAATEVETASLICRLVKMDFYGKAQARRSLGRNPVAGIIMDEFHYAVTSGSRRWSDISNLATLRAKGVFVVAATQGIIQLDLILGTKPTEALLINFSSLVLMRSQETGHLYALAEAIFGYKPQVVPPSRRFDDSDLVRSAFAGPPAPEPVCPSGALARLETHQAFVLLANGFRTDGPVWLAPLFFSDPEVEEPPEVDHDLDALRHAEFSLRPKAPPRAATRTYYSLRLWKFLIDAAPGQVRALQAITLQDFRQALDNMGHQPEGLKTIPAGWRTACLRLASELSEATRIAQLGSTNGMLDVTFVRATSRGLPPVFRLEARWKHSVYPSRIRRLHARDLRWLKKNFPHLCAEIAKPENPQP